MIDTLLASPLLGPGVAETARRLEELVVELPDGPERGRVLLRRAQLRTERRQHDLAVPDVLEASRLLDPHPGLREHAAMVGARLLARTGRLERAAQMLAEAGPAASSLGPDVRLAGYMAAGELALEQKRDVEAVSYFERASGLATGPGRAHDKYQALLCLGAAAQFRDDDVSALRWFSAAFDVAAEYRDGPRVAESGVVVANLLVPLGHYDEAAALYERALATGHVPPHMQPLCWSAVARVSLRHERFDAALDQALQASRAAAAAENPGGFADGVILAAMAQIGQGRPGEAQRTLTTGAEVLRGRSAPQPLVDLLLGEAAKIELPTDA